MAILEQMLYIGIATRPQELLAMQCPFCGQDNDKVICVNKFVGFDETDSLDTILRQTDIPSDFDVLSVDIDGNDYHVWDAARQYKPKIVVIEFNPTIPSSVEFVQPRDFGVTQGSSILSITKLAKGFMRIGNEDVPVSGRGINVLEGCKNELA